MLVRSELQRGGIERRAASSTGGGARPQIRVRRPRARAKRALQGDDARAASRVLTRFVVGISRTMPCSLRRRWRSSCRPRKRMRSSASIARRATVLGGSVSTSVARSQLRVARATAIGMARRRCGQQLPRHRLLSRTPPPRRARTTSRSREDVGLHVACRFQVTPASDRSTAAERQRSRASHAKHQRARASLRPMRVRSSRFSDREQGVDETLCARRR